MGIKRVVGVEFDGGSVTTTFGRIEIPALSAQYADGLETEAGHSMGSQQQDYRTAGTYKTDSIKIKFRSTVFRALLMPQFPTNGAGLIRKNVVVGFHHPDIGDDSDLLSQARCTNWSQACENSNKAIEVETTWECKQIFWTSDRKTINALRGVIPVGAVGF